MQRGYVRALLVIMAVLGVVLFVTGCIDDHSYSSTDNNSTMPAQPGDTVTVTLGENPSTGFVWNATTSGDLVITGNNYASGNPVGEMMGMVGGGGSRSWRLSVGKDHTQSFSAVLRRPGEPFNRTINTFEITFSVP
jgi:inhibitor of cysteine peptidase